MSTCWPGQCPDQLAGCRMMLFTRLVSATMACTRPVCHAILGCCRGASIAVITLLPPGIAIVVITTRFPEPGLVLGHEAKPSQPFCALPEVKMRHQKSRGATVRRGKRQTLIAGRDHRLSRDQVGHRKVRGV